MISRGSRAYPISARAAADVRLLRGEQKSLFDVLFRVPAECADMVAAGGADIGIIPTVELAGREMGILLMPRVHRIAGLLKRWLLGTHQGAVAPQHLSYYLDEFTFRFNRRKSKSRGKLFFQLLQQSAGTSPKTYDTLIGRSKPATFPRRATCHQRQHHAAARRRQCHHIP
jgi:hypothetical protein